MKKSMICLLLIVCSFTVNANIVKKIKELNTDSTYLYKLVDVAMQSQQDLFVIPADIETKQNIEIELLENNLKQKYLMDFSSHGWHGWLSLQRIVWQDAGFLKVVSSENGLKTLLNRAKLGKEQRLGPLPLTLSSALLYGLKSNLPAYMFTASPNWKNKPILAGVTWSSLRDMRIGPSAVEPVRDIDLKMVEDFQKTINNIKSVLLQTNPSNISPSPFLTKMFKLKSKELLVAFHKIINTVDKASILVSGSAGGSTSLSRMTGQSDEVMTEYKKILLHHKNMHEYVLSYGLVSHALDAKHFAAKLYVAKNDPSRNVDAFDRLMNKFKDKYMTDKAHMLIETRIQQIFMIILERKAELKMSEAELTGLL